MQCGSEQFHFNASGAFVESPLSYGGITCIITKMPRDRAFAKLIREISRLYLQFIATPMVLCVDENVLQPVLARHPPYRPTQIAAKHPRFMFHLSTVQRMNRRAVWFIFNVARELLMHVNKTAERLEAFIVEWNVHAHPVRENLVGRKGHGDRMLVLNPICYVDDFHLLR